MLPGTVDGMLETTVESQLSTTASEGISERYKQQGRVRTVQEIYR